jgi:hypothetical protein
MTPHCTELLSGSHTDGFQMKKSLHALQLIPLYRREHETMFTVKVKQFSVV